MNSELKLLLWQFMQIFPRHQDSGRTGRALEMCGASSQRRSFFEELGCYLWLLWLPFSRIFRNIAIVCIVIFWYMLFNSVPFRSVKSGSADIPWSFYLLCLPFVPPSLHRLAISGLTSQSAAEDGYLFFDWCLGDRSWTLVFSLTVAHVGSLWPTFLGWQVQGLCWCAVRFSIPQIDSSSRNLANSPWRFKTMTIPGRKKWCIFSRHLSYKDVVDRFSAWRRHWMLKSHEIISFRSWWTPRLGLRCHCNRVWLRSVWRLHDPTWVLCH